MGSSPSSGIESADRPLVQSLRRPAAYSHPVDAVDLLETHISWVLLAGDFAYKIKKPVNLGFVDFSTLKSTADSSATRSCDSIDALLRNFISMFCQSPARSQTRKSVVTGNQSNLRSHAAIRQGRLLSRVIVEGGLRAEHIDALARQVADFHRQIPAADVSSRLGRRRRS